MAIAIFCTAAKIFTPRIRSNFGIIASFLKECEERRTCQNAWTSITWKSYSREKHPEASMDYEKSEPNPKKKKEYVPRVTLISENNSMSVTTLEAAQKLAERRKLKLIKIMDLDTKTERPIYKLMTSKEFIQEGAEYKKQKALKKKLDLKEEKFLILSTKINVHDLQTKYKAILKFLKKRHEIRIVLSVDDNKERAENIYNEIQEMIKGLSTIKRTSTSSNYKIYLCPVIEAAPSTEPQAESEKEDEKLTTQT